MMGSAGLVFLGFEAFLWYLAFAASDTTKMNYLETHPTGISQLEAFNTLGICRLSERVRELEKRGYLIDRTFETHGKARVIRYSQIRCRVFRSTIVDDTSAELYRRASNGG